MEKGNNLEVLRFQLGISNRKFAELLGINETMYSKLKKGDYPIGDKTINRVIKAFPNYNYKWILFNEGDPKAIDPLPLDDWMLFNKIEEEDKYKDTVIKLMAQKIQELETKIKSLLS